MTIDCIDSDARRDALDMSRSFHVESPAGSGKTMLLTTRFVKLLGIVDQPGEILALTFTEKAAREMRNRIVDALQKARMGAQPSNSAEKELFAAAGEALHRHRDRLDLAATSQVLNVMTFHGFCNYLAARAPLEAGIQPDFTIADEATQKRLASESATRTIHRLRESAPDKVQRQALERRALHHDNNWQELTDELTAVIPSRDRFADLVGTIQRSGASDLSLFEETLKERAGFYVERRLAELRRAFSTADLGRRWIDFRAHLVEMEADAGENLPPSLPGTTWSDLPLWRTLAETLLTRQGTPRKQLGPKCGFYSGFQKSSWGELITDTPRTVAELLHETTTLPTEDEPAADMDVLSDLIVLCAEVIDDYEKLCTGKGLADFIGIEQCALRALHTTEPSDLALYLDHRLSHILIDEFQDANRTQWELLNHLVSGWERGDGRTVFIVGDPKQSIYSFRNAEVSLFFEAKEGIPRPGYEPLVPDSRLLETNFRSDRDLVNWVNDIFGATIMTEPDRDADEVPFSPSIPSRSKEDDPGALNLAIFGDEDRDKALDREAQWVASVAETVVAESDGSRSVGILLFTRNRLPRYLKALKERRVPVQVQEGLRLSNRPEIQHLIQTVRLLANPHDDLAWASLLRSPWHWCDQSVLIQTAMVSEVPWIDKLRHLSRDRDDLAILVSALDRALARLGRDSTGSVIRRLWEDLDGPARTAALYGMSGVANCIDLCRKLNDIEQGSPQATLARFETLRDDFFEPADPTMARSPVQVMTIHRAKGLEFDVVIVPFLDREPRSGRPGKESPYLVERVPGKSGEHLIATRKDRRAQDHSSLYKLLSRFEKERSLGEAKRWFYVAATRARSQLFLSGVANVKEGILVPPPRSPLKWVMKHEELDPLPAHEPLVTEGPGRLLSVAVNPPPSPAVTKGDGLARREWQLPKPLEIEPEKPFLSVKTPTSSSFEPEPVILPPDDKADEAIFPVTDEPAQREPSAPAIRGTIIHRLLKHCLEGRRRPDQRIIEKVLNNEGLSTDEARLLAPDIFRETEETLSSPFIADLISRNGARVKSEWKLERALSSSSVLSGTIDLAVFDGNCWWVIDFKTGAPTQGDDHEMFIQTEARRYRNQLRDYGKLLEAYQEEEPLPVRFGIFFTALGIWQEVPSDP